jgi:hypothetical protein
LYCRQVLSTHVMKFKGSFKLLAKHFASRAVDLIRGSHKLTDLLGASHANLFSSTKRKGTFLMYLFKDPDPVLSNHPHDTCGCTYATPSY